jgi:site-specific DNA-methyltransferase (adenine-specific)
MTPTAARLAIHFSSATDEWPTPLVFFDCLDPEFHFTLDPCATPENAKAARYFTRVSDGLRQPWSGTVFVNPPYGRTIGRWIAKGHEVRLRTAIVACLIPARTDTRYGHDYVMRAAEVRVLHVRLRFERGAHCAPFPSTVGVFRPKADGTAAPTALDSSP